MLVKVTLEAILELPDGTQWPTEGRAFTLPSGDWVKPFVVLEMNNRRDLSFKEAQALGCDVSETRITIEAAGCMGADNA